MKKNCLLIVGILVLLSNAILSAQHHYNIRLAERKNAPIGKKCYYIQLASADAFHFNLAGQNYRMYYDATKLKYNNALSQLLLPNEKYTNLVIKNNLYDIDASGVGPLPFDDHLSFLNIGNDLKEELTGGIFLPASGAWINTAQICFDRMDQEEAITSQNDYEVYWARPELTQAYASAYVEVAEWTAPYVTKPAKVAIYFDEQLSTLSNEQHWERELKIYPNPTQNKIFIEFPSTELLLIQVYTTNGQLVLKDFYPVNSGRYSIDLGNLSNGIYQLRLSNEHTQIVKRIEKIK